MTRALGWAWLFLALALVMTYVGQLGWGAVFLALGFLAFVSHMMNNGGKS